MPWLTPNIRAAMCHRKSLPSRCGLAFMLAGL